MSSLDPASIESLLRHRDWVRRLARSMVRDPGLADDVEQETWLSALRRPPRAAAAMRSWLSRVLRNRVHQEHRTQSRADRREKEVARGRPDSSEPPTDEIVARAETQRNLVAAVFDLEEPYRTTVLLRFFEELPASEVALRMNVAPNTVAVRTRRALERLRQRLDSQHHGWAVLLGVLPAASVAKTAAVTTTATHWGLSFMATQAKQLIAFGIVGCALLLLGLVHFASDSSGRAGRGDDDGARARSARPAGDEDGGSSGAAGARDGGAGSNAHPDGAHLSGDVRFAADGRPADGVGVRLAGPDGNVATTTTSGAGYFAFPGIAAGGAYTVSIDAATMAPVRVGGIHLAAHAREHLETLWLDTPVTARVRVRGDQARPVAGATVTAFRARKIVRSQDWAGQPRAAAARRTTGADGVALFDDLPPGHWTFRAEAAGYAPGGAAAKPLLRGGAAVSIEIALERGHALTGIVTGPDGKPVEGAAVLALAPRDAKPMREPSPTDPLRVETLSGADGRYRFEALPRGPHSIGVVPKGGLPCRIAVIEVPSVSVFDIALDGGLLRGRVTLEGSDEPLAGVALRVAVWRRHSPTYLTAVTNADGRYEIRVPIGGVVNGPARGEGDARARTVNFEATKQGYVMAPSDDRFSWSNPWVLGGQTSDFDVKMRPAAQLTGTVAGPDGPVPGARVVADLWHEYRGSLRREAVTDGAGRYEFHGLPEGRAMLRVEKAGLIQDPAPSGNWRGEGEPPASCVVDVPARGGASLDLELVAGASLEGRVQTPAGAPLAAARVAVGSIETTTGADGVFRLAGLPRAGPVPLMVDCDGYAGVEREVQPAADDIEITLSPTGSVSGRVTGPDGAPLSTAFVQVAPASTLLEGGYEIVSIWQKAPRVPVAADGTFTAPLPWYGGAIESGVVVRAVANGYAPAASEPLAEEQRASIVLRLGKSQTLRGRVVAADGSGPLAGARVEFANKEMPPGLGQRRDWSMVGLGNHPFEIVAMTDADGRFEVGDLPPWNYQLRVQAQGFGWGNATVKVPSARELVIEMTRALTIQGRARYPDGEPVRFAQVVARPAGTQGMAGAAATDAEGRFEIGVAASPVELELSSGWREPVAVRRTKSEPIEGGATEVELVAERSPHLIRGRCVDDAGAGVPGAWVVAKRLSGAAPNVVTRSKPSGAFEFAGLEEGDYTLSASANRSLGGPEKYGVARAVEIARVPVGSDGLVLVFERALPLAGRVERADGEPVRGGAVVRATGLPESLWATHAPVQPDGTFRFASLVPRGYRLEVLSQQNQTIIPSRGGAKVAAGEENARLVVSAGATIAGAVVDAAGKPVPGARVFATAAGRTASATTDGKGAFQIAGLGEASHFRVEARHDALGRAAAPRVASGTGDLRLVLAEVEALSARLLDAAGVAARNRLVLVEQEDGSATQRLRTDSNGRFETRALPAGAYRVFLLGAGGEKTACGTVRTGQPETVLRVD